MVYTSVGTLFLIVFGIGLGINAIFYSEAEYWSEVEPLRGSPVKYNLTGHIIPVTEMNDYSDDGVIPAKHDLPIPADISSDIAKRRAIIFMAFICVAVTIALGNTSKIILVWENETTKHFF